MKRFFLTMIIISSGVAAFGFDINYCGLVFEPSLGAGTGGFSGYNNILPGQGGAFTASGYKASLTGVDYSAIFSLGAIALFDTPAYGAAGAGLCVSYMRAGTGGAVYYHDGSAMEKRDVFFSYYGLELCARKYFTLSGELKCFGGIRCGMFIAVNNYIEEETYDSSGNLEKATIEDIDGVIPGASAEAGLEYSIEKDTGLFVNFGFRAASGSRQASFRSTDENINGTMTNFNSDFSGFYAQLGGYYSFDGNKANQQYAPAVVKESGVTPLPTAAMTATSDATATFTAVTAAATVEIATATAAAVIISAATATATDTATTVAAPEVKPAVKATPVVTATAAAAEDFSGEGDAEIIKGDYASAASLYKNAAALSPGPLIFKKLGNCFYYMQNTEEAVKYYSKSLELNPGDDELKKFLDTLR